MCNVLHYGALTVELDSADNATLKIGGKCPTSDYIVLDPITCPYKGCNELTVGNGVGGQCEYHTLTYMEDACERYTYTTAPHLTMETI